MDDPDYGLTPETKRYLDKEFGQIDSRCTRLKTQSRDDLPKNGSIPRLLFHYTNAEATRKILTSSSLWATDVQSLPDTAEFRYGIGLACRLLSELAIGPKAAFLRHAVELLNAWLEDADSEPYVVSFSSDDGSRQSQWESHGDGGAGFSIGFDYGKLRCHFRETVTAGVLPVTYEPEAQRQILTTEIDSYWKACENAGGEAPDLRSEIETYCRINLVSLLVTECAAFKHPGFREEQEFRLVARRKQGQPKPNFRTGKFGITPYLDLKSPHRQKLPVVKIMQGPTADRQSAEKGIKMLLADLGYPAVDADVSKIPQR